MKLLIDSCVERFFATELSKKHSVCHMNDIWASAPDGFVYSHSRKKKAILITSNYKDFENTGRFVLKNHPGCIVFHKVRAWQFKRLFEIVLAVFPKKSDYFEKRIIVKKTKIEVLSAKGIKEVFWIKN